MLKRCSILLLTLIINVSCSIKNKPIEEIKSSPSPEDYVIDKFEDHSIVLLGEDHGIKQNLDFVRNMIPTLYENGIYQIGMEFGAFEVQDLLDSLLAAPEYHDALAKEMMYFYNVGWAYKDYRDIYKSAWEFNQTLQPDQRKFRIVNLSYHFDWTKFNMDDKECMGDVFYRGEIDSFRYELVKREIVEPKEKALLLVGTPHAFTKFLNKKLPVTLKKDCPCQSVFLGNRLYDLLEDDICTILLHQGFYGTEASDYKLISPADGKIEALMKQNNYKPVGFDLTGTVGEFSDHSFYSSCHDTFKLQDFFDGYIFLAPFSEMEGCTFDDYFYEGKDYASEIYPEIPDPNWNPRPRSAEEYIQQRKEYVDIKNRYKDIIIN
ncbi:hypothetical protein [Flammeovirga sp. SubArs3]|uniref:hypothetical protein n=1 Tax=Flammeovirga sp. SubArs3 TaxID=2995316 RepID=UPI00248B88CF|nr:hypothetical protein [Flammeovirga sp. SubArs3]